MICWWVKSRKKLIYFVSSRIERRIPRNWQPTNPTLSARPDPTLLAHGTGTARTGPRRPQPFSGEPAAGPRRPPWLHAEGGPLTFWWPAPPAAPSTPSPAGGRSRSRWGATRLPWPCFWRKPGAPPPPSSPATAPQQPQLKPGPQRPAAPRRPVPHRRPQYLCALQPRRPLRHAARCRVPLRARAAAAFRGSAGHVRGRAGRQRRPSPRCGSRCGTGCGAGGSGGRRVAFPSGRAAARVAQGLVRRGGEHRGPRRQRESGRVARGCGQ